MLQARATKQFERDFRLMQRQGKDIENIKSAVLLTAGAMVK